MRIARFACVLLSAAISGCAKPAPRSTFAVTYTGPSIQAVAVNYTNYSRLTDDYVLVTSDLSLRCLGISAAEAEAAQIRNGARDKAAVMIYMNARAARAFRSGADAYPVGAAIVKQKMAIPPTDKGEWSSELRKKKVGGMVKRPAGYDPANGDWEYFDFEDPSDVESGPIGSCVQCHSAAKSTDYVFGTWRKPREQASLLR